MKNDKVNLSVSDVSKKLRNLVASLESSDKSNHRLPQVSPAEIRADVTKSVLAIKRVASCVVDSHCVELALRLRST